MNHKYYSDMPMNWNDIDILQSNNVTIGSHCHDHLLLHSNQTKNDIIEQIETSKKIIEGRYGFANFFAIQMGYLKIYLIIHTLHKRKFSLGLTTAMGVVLNSTDKLNTSRIIAPEDFEQFKFNLNYSVISNKLYKSGV